MTILLIIIAVMLFLLVVFFDPYLDVFKIKGKYNILLWYTNLNNERNYLTILGG